MQRGPSVASGKEPLLVVATKAGGTPRLGFRRAGVLLAPRLEKASSIKAPLLAGRVLVTSTILEIILSEVMCKASFMLRLSTKPFGTALRGARL